MKIIILPFMIVSAFMWSGHALGQGLSADPSALVPTDSSPAWGADDGSGRYIHKPKSKSKKAKREIASDLTAAPSPSPSPAPEITISPIGPGVRIPPKDVESPGSPGATPGPTPTPAPVDSSFSARLRDVVLGGDTDLLQSYRAFLDNQDIRKNIFEITLASGYLYNASSSSYYFKNYNDSGPTIDLAADVWLSPFWGIDAEYKTTLLNEVSDSPIQNTYASISQSWFDFGMKFRRFFGMSLNATSFTLGLKYFNYQMSVPQSSQSKAKLQNQGPELDLDVTIPSSHFAFWTMGLLLQPLDNLSEASGASVRAGQSNQTVGIGASVGGEYRFSRQSTAFFKLSSVLYKSDFSGAATNADPVTGAVPSNVPVTNIFYFLDLGVRFGH